MFHVAHTTASLHGRSGGPPRTVTGLAEGLGHRGIQVDVITLRDDDSSGQVRPDGDVVETSLVEPGVRGARRFRRAVEGLAPDVVHDHGLWLPTNYASASAARSLGAPLVVSTRGMLEPWALRQGRTKKAIAWALYQRRNLASAAFLHATAESEAVGIRGAGVRVPVAIVPNGVTVPDSRGKRPVRGGHDRVRRRALFLSRVHPKKGLPMLFEAWGAVRPSGWELVVAGPDEGGHRAELERLATRLGLDHLEFRAGASDEEKWDLYRSADLFVLPTHSENFGVVVAEALAAGVPAVTTTGAPWGGLLTHSCGWWVEPKPRAIAEAIRAATSASDAERVAMGERGRAYVTSEFGWEGIAVRMIEAYEWALGLRTSRPDFVYAD